MTNPPPPPPPEDDELHSLPGVSDAEHDLVAAVIYDEVAFDRA